jgi:hypothetical protein
MATSPAVTLQARGHTTTVAGRSSSRRGPSREPAPCTKGAKEQDEDDMTHASPSRLRKLAKGLAYGIVGLAVLYVVVLNVALKTRFLRDLITYDPNALKVDYASAHSWWPGNVHVEGLTLRGKDTSVEWILRLDRCDFRPSFTELWHHRFHASHVVADGLSLHVRQRIDAALVVPAETALLPPVEGFADPPLKDATPPPPPPTDATYDLWSILLEGVDVDHVRDVWIDSLRYAGDARVRGRWLFRPLRLLEVGPATIDARGIDVSRGEAALAKSLTGTMVLRIEPFDVRDKGGLGVLDIVTLHGHVHGAAPTVAGLNAFLAPAARFSGADGTLDAALEMTAGVLEVGTRVHVTSPSSGVELSGIVVRAPFDAELAVDARPDGAAGGKLSVLAREVQVSKGDARLAIANVAADLTSGALRIAHQPFGDAAFRLDVSDATSSTLGAWVHGFAPSAPLSLESGAAKAKLHLEGDLPSARAHGDVALAVHALDVRAGEAVARAELEASTHVFSLDAKGIELAGAVDLREVVVAAPTTHGAKETHVALQAPSLHAATKRLRLGEDGATGELSVRLPPSVIPSAAALGAALRLPAGVLVGGAGTVAGELDASLPSGAGTGALRVTGKAVSLRVAGDVVAADLRVDVTARKEGGVIDLHGTRAFVRNASAGSDTGWWANLDLERATLSLSPLRFQANARATARDAHFVLADVAGDERLPGWVTEVLRMNALRVEADVRATPTSLAFHSVVARGTGASIRAEYAAHDAHKDGAALVELGPLRVATTLARAPSTIVVLGASSWFDERVAALRRDERSGPEGKGPATLEVR